MITVYTTCPSSHEITPEAFRRRIVDVARWTEDADCRGLLVYTDNTLVDPWATAQAMIAATERLVPLVAVQPLYMHPYSVARMISSIAFLYGRSVDLNLVTGGFAGHLRELGDLIDHDERYDRLVEYAKIVKKLLVGKRPVTHLGRHYSLNAASIEPAMDPALMPGILVSGTSEACERAQEALGATRLAYPRAVDTYDASAQPLAGNGIRLGIIARDSAVDAWRIAHERFPSDELGEQLHRVAAEQVESQWHIGLSRDALSSTGPLGCYWLHPFKVYKTFCPYLVGTYEDVAALLARYFDLGVRTIVLDVPREADDLHHARTALRLAEQLAANPVPS
ncbi:LLM class flavin-dependent oxidoreductase [Kutzneria buriramensis]|uniref:Alkanesulfonate monooxygenase n=1 Tax=Kutzneria buriramensis TaxID=1045776 RepID=A0A3E0H6V8_9PSEU|nr:LLM class flavin-dependent oxidoreductase [Kutzneria buriramensis]REH39189.1 alkanesulfonate monooxygenase [Kutzneria buriramensis]